MPGYDFVTSVGHQPALVDGRLYVIRTGMTSPLGNVLGTYNPEENFLQLFHEDRRHIEPLKEAIEERFGSEPDIEIT